MPVRSHYLNPPDPDEDPIVHCLWCGEKLKHRRVAIGEEYIGEGGQKYVRVAGKRNMFENPGVGGNGYFCSLGCGFNFGLQYARFGKRLTLSNEGDKD